MGHELVVAAAARCERVFIASLLNLSAVVEAARAAGEDVVVVCAGVQGTLALDDAFVAGRIVELLDWKRPMRPMPPRGSCRPGAGRRRRSGRRRAVGISWRTPRNSRPTSRSALARASSTSCRGSSRCATALPRSPSSCGVALLEPAERDDDGAYHPHGRDDTDRHRSRLAGVIVNRDPKARGPYTAFADVAGAYERGRPGYPDEAVRWLVGDEPARCRRSRRRHRKAHAHARRPRAPRDSCRAARRDARRAGRACSPRGSRARPGNAEAIPLPAASADVVASAQAFHWLITTTPCPRSSACYGRQAASRSSGTPATIATRGWRGSPRSSATSRSRSPTSSRCSTRQPALRSGRDRGFLVPAGARPRRSPRPRPLAESPREASACRASGRSSTPSVNCTTRPPVPKAPFLPTSPSASARRASARESRRKSLELAMHGLDVVAVGVEQEGCVVAATLR